MKKCKGFLVHSVVSTAALAAQCAPKIWLLSLNSRLPSSTPIWRVGGACSKACSPAHGFHHNVPGTIKVLPDEHCPHAAICVGHFDPVCPYQDIGGKVINSGISHSPSYLHPLTVQRLACSGCSGNTL